MFEIVKIRVIPSNQGVGVVAGRQAKVLPAIARAEEISWHVRSPRARRGLR